jgi:hypothetical protein
VGDLDVEQMGRGGGFAAEHPFLPQDVVAVISLA